jgi:signal transduction histidine kinase
MESSNLAWLEFRKKNYPKAKEYFKESIRLHKQIDDISGLSEASIGLAEILFEEKLYKQAITLAKKSLDNSYKISNPEGIIGSSKIISNSYEKLGDYYTALTFYKIYEANKDSINKLHSKQEYLNVLTKFEVEQKEGRIKLLESEKKLTQAEADNKALQRNIIIGLLVVIVAAFAAYYIRSKEIKKIEIAQHSEKLQMTFSEKLLKQQEDERKRIAAELHDSLGQNLLIIKNMLDYITHSLSESNETKSQLEELSAIALNSIEEVRTTASNLHPYQLKKMGLSKAISAMIRNFKQGTQININHEIDDVDGKISKESEAHIYRIVQEIMNNAIRHSDASEINISLKNKNDNLIIMINDNGKGFNINNYESHESVSGGFGIIGIKERIRIIGAEIKIESNLGIGSRFEILLPIRTV